MRALLAGAALGTILLASVGSAAPGSTKPRTLAMAGPVLGLAADGERVALDVGLPGRCARVLVWEPLQRRVVSLLHRGRCEGIRKDIHVPALAGTRAAWYWRTGGNGLETIVLTATLAHPTPVRIADGNYGDMDGDGGDFARPPVGDGALLAFTVELRCGPDSRSYPCPPGGHSGDVLHATIWRVGGRDRCPSSPGSPLSPRCTAVAEADGELSLLAVDSGRIAERTATGVRLITGAGGVLRDFAVRANAAALSGNRLALRTADGVEVYDTDSGRLAARFRSGHSLRLQDLDNGILVTASARTVTLRRLRDGRKSTIQFGGIARAQLERPGLFVAGGQRVTFMPMRDVLRRFGD
jgi:hypothetical protein